MTFEIPQPSMVMNAQNVPPPDYSMWNSYKVSASSAPQDFMSWTAKVAKDRGGLKCLITNSHGAPGQIKLGTGLTIAEAPLFSQLNGYVKAIFIVTCRVAGSPSSASACPIGRGPALDGNLMCGAIAKQSGAVVFCSTDLQDTGAWTVAGLPYGYIDEYEGNIYRYDSDGSNVVVSNANITSYLRNLKLGVNRTW